MKFYNKADYHKRKFEIDFGGCSINSLEIRDKKFIFLTITCVYVYGSL